MASKSKKSKFRQGSQMLGEVLAKAEPRPSPSDSKEAKNQYAVRFADSAAAEIAMDLEPHMKGITANAQRSATSVRGPKQLDVNYSTQATGLAVGISLKSVHIREATGAGRYTHNMKRNEEELRIEALGYHKRQPYAVMIGVLFIPFDSCDDAKIVSSFASWVKHLRPFAGRTGPRDDEDSFEKIYIALYEPDGSDLRFFDVDGAPPKVGRPPIDGELFAKSGHVRRALTYEEFLGAVIQLHLARNKADFQFAEEEAD